MDLISLFNNCVSTYSPLAFCAPPLFFRGLFGLGHLSFMTSFKGCLLAVFP